MSTLLLTLHAPLQSWGISTSYTNVRYTGTEPSKSGVIGMIACAMGIERSNDTMIQKLTQKLKYGVRIDKEGILTRDFQIAYDDDKKYTYATNKYYLADAKFTVGLESDDEELLLEIQEAFKFPLFSPYLGRKSCPVNPDIIRNKIHAVSLETALKTQPQNKDYSGCRIVRDANPGEYGELRHDVPISFRRENRKYGWRKVVEEFITAEDNKQLRKKIIHDPFAEL